MKTQYTVLFFLIISFLGAKQEQAYEKIFSEAAQWQKQGEFEKALKVYWQIEKAHVESENLFYNMGNCYYRLKQWGAARAYYDKTLKINPLNDDAKSNLEMTIKKINPHDHINQPENPLKKLTRYQWLALTTVLILFFSVCFILFKTLSQLRLRRLMLSFLFIIGLFSIVSLSGYFSLFFESKQAIVIKDLEAKESPLEKSLFLKNLHVGDKVTILKKLNDWTKIKQDENVFWVKSKGIIEI